jgi:hypothetical protein
MQRIGLAVAVACLLCACAPTMEVKESTAMRGKGVAKCDTTNLAWAKGQPANEENARRLVRESGLGLWRIIGPDNVERADYRPDRLTIYTDKDNIIQSLDCH